MVESHKPRLRRIMRNTNPTALKKLAIAFAIVVLALATYLIYLAPHTLEAKQRAELESTQNQLIKTKSLLQQQKALDAKQDAEKQKQIQEVQKKLEETEKALQAKRQANTAIAAAPVAAPNRQSVAVSGDKVSWMAAAGISPADYTYVDYIISHESGWNPNAMNASSGAEGLPQALPYSKTGCAHGDAVCQMVWANSYAINRYGSWSGAYAFWINNKWW